jgi:hypothetical protein
MSNKTENFHMRVNSRWLERLDAWRDQQPAKPSRAEAIRAAVEMLIAGAEKAGEQPTEREIADAE